MNININPSRINKTLDRISQFQFENDAIKTKIYVNGNRLVVENLDTANKIHKIGGYLNSSIIGDYYNYYAGWETGIAPLVDLSDRMSQFFDKNVMDEKFLSQINKNSLEAAVHKTNEIFHAIHSNDSLKEQIGMIHENINHILHQINLRNDPKYQSEIMNHSYIEQIGQLLEDYKDIILIDKEIRQSMIDQSYKKRRTINFSYPDLALKNSAEVTELKVSPSFAGDFERSMSISINNKPVFNDPRIPEQKREDLLDKNGAPLNTEYARLVYDYYNQNGGEQNASLHPLLANIGYDQNRATQTFEYYYQEDNKRIHLLETLLKDFDPTTVRHLTALMNQASIANLIINCTQVFNTNINSEVFFIVKHTGGVHFNILTDVDKDGKKYLTLETKRVIVIETQEKGQTQPLCYFLYHSKATALTNEWREELNQEEESASDFIPSFEFMTEPLVLRTSEEECQAEINHSIK